MDSNSKRALFLILGWITTAAVIGQVAGYYYMRCLEYERLLKEYESCVIRVNICIDYYGWNGTIIWHNNTIVPLGCNLFEATKKVVTVNATYWPAFNSHFVDAINGVWRNQTYFWMWYRWDNATKTWIYGNVGPDLYILSDGEIIKWRYEIPSYP